MRTQQLPRLSVAAIALVPHLLTTSLLAVTASATSDLSDGEIAGVVVGSVGGALLLAFLIFSICCIRAWRRRQTGDLTWMKTTDLEVAEQAFVHTLHQPLSGPCAEDLAASERRTFAAAAGDPAAANINGHNHNSTEQQQPQEYRQEEQQQQPTNRTDASTATAQSIATADGGMDFGSTFPNFSPSPLRSPGMGDGGGGGVEGDWRGAGRKASFFRNRSWGYGASGTGGGVAHWFNGGVKKVGRIMSARQTGSSPKDKHLEVSWSARVEPSAELELAEPFQPAATNLGPPLSKSSMLLRWLNGADEGLHPEAAAAAAQLAAAAVAVGDRPSGRDKEAAGRGGAAGIDTPTVSGGGRVGGGGGGGLGSAPLDRLPLLSLAAQQSGIVWSKMPPSVASSPAVSQVESCSMHMLRGTMKRSDEPDVATGRSGGRAISSSGNPNATSTLATWHEGDDRYPSSLGRVSLDAFLVSEGCGGAAAPPRRSTAGGDGAASASRPGIVFDYVVRPSRSTNSSRTNTGGGAPSGAGDVLPTSNDDDGRDGTTTRVALSAQPLKLGSGADGAVTQTGTLSNGHTLLHEAHHRNPPSRAAIHDSVATAAAAAVSPRPSNGRLWLHQTPPTKLAALQETDAEVEEEEEQEEGGDGEGEDGAQKPLPRQTQPSQSSRSSFPSKQLLPMAPLLLQSSPRSAAAAAGAAWSAQASPKAAAAAGAAQSSPRAVLPEGSPTPPSSSPHATRRGWMHFGDGDSAQVVPPGGGFGLGQGAVVGVVGRPQREPPLPVSFAAAANDTAALAAAKEATSYAAPQPAGAAAAPGPPASKSPAGARIGVGVDVGVLSMPGRRPIDLTVTMAELAPAGGAQCVSPRGSASQVQRRTGAPPPPPPLPLHETQSSKSLRSQTSLISPSLSMHYPESPGVAVPESPAPTIPMPAAAAAATAVAQ